ncbi:hypothetical protein ABZP36_021247 [Zizania latifolia]
MESSSPLVPFPLLQALPEQSDGRRRAWEQRGDDAPTSSGAPGQGEAWQRAWAKGGVAARLGEGRYGSASGIDEGGAEAEEDAPWPRDPRRHQRATGMGSGGASAERSMTRHSQSEEGVGAWRKGDHGGGRRPQRLGGEGG